MTTLIIITDDDQKDAVREALGSETDAGEMVHFVRLPPVTCVGEMLQDLSPASDYGVDYTVQCVSGEARAARIVEFARERRADRICIGISERTLTGKAKINELTQSILLHPRITGDLAVGNSIIVLDDLEYS